MAELVIDLAEAQTRAEEAAERTDAARKGAEAAAVLVEQSSARASSGDYEVVCEAMASLINALHAAAEGAGSAAQTAADVSTRLPGHQARAASACKEGALGASEAAQSCTRMAAELGDALCTVRRDFDGVELDNESLALALRLLTSTAQGSRNTTEDASRAAASAARAVARALAAVRPQRAPDRAPNTPRRGSPRQQPPEQPANSPRGSAARPPRATSGRESPSEPGAGPASPQDNSSSTTAGAPNRARSGSSGPRGRAEAHVQRHVRSFEEMAQSNKELLRLQHEVHEALARSPLLLPPVPLAQRERIFGLAAAVLAEAAADLIASGTPERSAEALLPWLCPGECEAAICDVRAGALRLAALLDMKAVESLLSDAFTSALLIKDAEADEALKASVAQLVEALRTWSATRHWSL